MCKPNVCNPIVILPPLCISDKNKNCIPHQQNSYHLASHSKIKVLSECCFARFWLFILIFSIFLVSIIPFFFKPYSTPVNQKSEETRIIYVQTGDMNLNIVVKDTELLACPNETCELRGTVKVGDKLFIESYVFGKYSRTKTGFWILTSDIKPL